MNKTTAWVLIAAAFLIGGAVGFLAMRQRAIDNMEAYKLSAQRMVDETRMAAEKEVEEVMEAKESEVVLMANDAEVGAYATDTNGMALYTYDRDTEEGESSCIGQCAVNWPPYVVSGTVPAELQDNVGTIERENDVMQYTWKGKPLYFYIQDTEQGDVTGDGVGGIWHVAK